MDSEIILSLYYAEQGYTDSSMAKHMVESPETKKAWEKLDALLTPLNMEAMELASEYGSGRARDGFLNGFRLAVRLMMESLLAPPQGAERPSA